MPHHDRTLARGFLAALRLEVVELLVQVLRELPGDLGIGRRSAVAVRGMAGGADLRGDALRLGGRRACARACAARQQRGCARRTPMHVSSACPLESWKGAILLEYPLASTVPYRFGRQAAAGLPAARACPSSPSPGARTSASRARSTPSPGASASPSRARRPGARRRSIFLSWARSDRARWWTCRATATRECRKAMRAQLGRAGGRLSDSRRCARRRGGAHGCAPPADRARCATCLVARPMHAQSLVLLSKADKLSRAEQAATLENTRAALDMPRRSACCFRA